MTAANAITADKLSDIAAQLSAAKSVLVCSHIAPDPDAVSSSCGLALALQQRGIKTTAFLEDKPHPRLAKLYGKAPLVHEIPAGKFDVVAIVDTATKERVGKQHAAVLELAPVVLNIDHHISNTRYGTVNYIHPEHPSTASIILELLELMKLNISADLASLLLSGLMDDTGSFRFSNATPLAFDAAKRLVALGASPHDVANILYYELPEKMLQLRALALSSLQFLCAHRVVLMTISRKMLESCHADVSDTEGLVDEARTIGGTAAVVLMRELDDGWKLSLRAKNDALDVSAIASEFGGGGHRAAAGCKLKTTQQEAVQIIEDCFSKAISRL